MSDETQHGTLHIEFGEASWQTRAEVDGKPVGNLTGVDVHAGVDSGVPEVTLTLLGGGRDALAPLTVAEWKERHLCGNCGIVMDHHWWDKMISVLIEPSLLEEYSRDWSRPMQMRLEKQPSGAYSIWCREVER